MLDKIVGVIAMIGLLTFLGILVGFVQKPALFVVVGIVVVLACGDFYFTLFKGRKGNGNL